MAWLAVIKGTWITVLLKQAVVCELLLKYTIRKDELGLMFSVAKFSKSLLVANYCIDLARAAELLKLLCKQDRSTEY